MNLLKTIHYQSTITRFYRFAPTRSFASSVSLSPQRHIISLVSISNRGRCFAFSSVSGASLYNNQEDGKKEESERNYASTKEGDEVVYQKTLRLVECAMFAAVTGLVYFLSNSLAIENYFGCFFSLPIVISSIRWNIAGGRKTMVCKRTFFFSLIRISQVFFVNMCFKSFVVFVCLFLRLLLSCCCSYYQVRSRH
jgi:hypothetical protein